MMMMMTTFLKRSIVSYIVRSLYMSFADLCLNDCTRHTPVTYNSCVLTPAHHHPTIVPLLCHPSFNSSVPSISLPSNQPPSGEKAA